MCMFLGYSPTQRGYMRNFVQIDVTFYKSKPYYKYSGYEFTRPMPQTTHSTINLIHFLEFEVSSEAQLDIKIDNT